MHAVHIVAVPGLLFLLAVGAMLVAAWCWICASIAHWLIRRIFGSSDKQRINYRAGAYDARRSWEPVPPKYVEASSAPPSFVYCSKGRKRSGAGAVVLTLLAVGLVGVVVEKLTERGPGRGRSRPEAFTKAAVQRMEAAKARALAVLEREQTQIVHDSADLAVLHSREGVWDVDGVGETVTDAEQDAYEKAQDQVAVYLHQRFPEMAWPVSLKYVRDHLVSDFQKQDDLMPGVKRVRLHVQLKPDQLGTILQTDLRYRRENRVIWLGRVLAALLAVLGTAALYLRLDEASKGYYTGLLRVGGIAIVAAAAASLWYFA